jgi:hypothetical protein
MSWGDAIQGVTGLFGANQQQNAADAQAEASAAAIAEQRRQFDQLQQNQQPYMQYGQGQISGLQSLASGDYSGFTNSPDYKYARDQMIYGQDHSAAARGRLNSGGYGMDLAKGLNGLASQNLGNYRQSLQWGANLGQNAAAGVGQAGMQSANNIGGLMQDRAQAQSSGYGGWAGAVTGLGGIAASQPWASGSIFGGGSGGGGSSGSFGMPAQGTGNNGFFSGNWGF